MKKTEVPLGEYRWLTVVSPEDPDGTELLLEPDGTRRQAVQDGAGRGRHPAARPSPWTTSTRSSTGSPARRAVHPGAARHGAGHHGGARRHLRQPAGLQHAHAGVRELRRAVDQVDQAACFRQSRGPGDHLDSARRHALDAPAHFLSGGKFIGDLPIDWLVGPACVVDLEKMGVGTSSSTGRSTSSGGKRIQELDQRDDILIIHTGYHRYYPENWTDRSETNETKYFIRHPGPTHAVRGVDTRQRNPLLRHRRRHPRSPDEHGDQKDAPRRGRGCRGKAGSLFGRSFPQARLPSASLPVPGRSPPGRLPRLPAGHRGGLPGAAGPPQRRGDVPRQDRADLQPGDPGADQLPPGDPAAGEGLRHEMGVGLPATCPGSASRT